MQAQSRGGGSSSSLLFAEQLEARTLLSVTIANGEMQIFGTDADDVIVIRLDADDPNLLVIEDNDVSTFYEKRQLSLDVFAFFIEGFDGNDLLQIDESNGKIRIGVQIQGDAGDDTIIGGSGNDFIVGSDGNDSLIGGGGTDFFFGGLDDDEIFGGDGRDHIRGGEGDDTLNGNNGNDDILGEVGDDVISGGRHNDS